MPLHTLSGSGVWSDLQLQSDREPPTHPLPTQAPAIPPYTDAAIAPSAWSARAVELSQSVACLRARHAFDLERDRAERARAWKVTQVQARYDWQTPRKAQPVPEYVTPAGYSLQHRAQVAAWEYLPAPGSARESTFAFSPLARQPPAGSGQTPFSAPSKLSQRDRLILDAFDFSYKQTPPAWRLAQEQQEPPIQHRRDGMWPAAINLSSDERTSGNTSSSSSSSSAFRTAASASSSSHEFTSGSSDPLSSLAELTAELSAVTTTSGSEREGRRQMFRVENRDRRDGGRAGGERRNGGGVPAGSVQAPPIATLPDREAQLVLSPFGAGGNGSLQLNRPLSHQFATPTGATPSFGSPLTYRSDMSTLLGLTPAANQTRAYGGPSFGSSDTDRSLMSPLTPLQQPTRVRSFSPSRFQQGKEATRAAAAVASSLQPITSGSSSSLDGGLTSSSDRDFSHYSHSGFLSVTHLDG